MNSPTSYIVIACTDGDGEMSGRRIWSERFNTRAAGDRASTFLKQNPEIRAWVIEDCIYPPAPEPMRS